MLHHLSIRNIVLIEQLDIIFQKGLCVLTGETGAGKSILLDALSLALGARADPALIRHGTSLASVTVTFTEVSSPVLELLQELGIAPEDDLLVCRRVLSADRTSKAFINDQPVTASALRQVGELLVDIHGQFDAMSERRDFRNSLDQFLQDKMLLASVKEAYHTLQLRRDDVVTFREKLQHAHSSLPFWEQAAKEIAQAKPLLGEVSRLQEARDLRSHQGKLIETLKELLTYYDAPLSLVSTLTSMSRLAEKLGSIHDAFQSYRTAFETVLIEVQEAQATLLQHYREMTHEAASFEHLEERLFLLRSLGRKHHCDPDELPVLLERLHTDIDHVKEGASHLDALEEAYKHAREIYYNFAQTLHQARMKAAEKLGQDVNAELPALNLGSARFVVEVKELPETAWGEHGIDHVAFLIATNEAAKPGPLLQIASGGERSRLQLAIKLALADVHPTMTFVFDEVDSGIGGPTAAAVGERLLRLAQHRQVLVITHSPQVAASGDTHWHVQKVKEDKGIITTIVQLDLQQRQEKIARMLSGAAITDEARAAAARLLGGK